MMQHPRAIIRAKVRDLLRDAEDGAHPTAAAHRVQASRTIPIWPRATPAIAIYTREERVDGAAPDSPELPRRRLLTLVVEAYATGEDADDVVDRLAAEIELRLSGHDTLGGLVERVRLVQTEITLAGDAEAPVVVGELAWEVAYWTVPAAPAAGTLPDAVHRNIFPPFGADHAEDYRPLEGP